MTHPHRDQVDRGTPAPVGQLDQVAPVGQLDQVDQVDQVGQLDQVAPVDDPDACETCHGEGELECVRGCHVIDCPDCEGTGDK